jgi:hypothetical protein
VLAALFYLEPLFWLAIKTLYFIQFLSIVVVIPSLFAAAYLEITLSGSPSLFAFLYVLVAYSIAASLSLQK